MRRATADRWPWLAAAPCVRGVHLLGPSSSFEEHYAATRTQEDRVLDDGHVCLLPDGTGLWNAAEWRIRKRSAQRLSRSLREQGPDLDVLEVGCGNGWLSAWLARQGHHVLGIDLFTQELEQAARVFAEGPVFARADPFLPAIPQGAFDAVVFAASIQYFPDPVAVMRRALELVRPNGRVHVLDTVLYRDPEAARDARERSRTYYVRIGHPELGEAYHAHTLQQLMEAAPARIVAAPRPHHRFLRLLGLRSSPFTHLHYHR